MPIYNCLHHNQRMSERIVNNKIQPYCLECRKIQLVDEKTKEYMDNEEYNIKQHKKWVRSEHIDSIKETWVVTFFFYSFCWIAVPVALALLHPSLKPLVIILGILFTFSFTLKRIFTIPNISSIYSKPKEEDSYKLAEEEMVRNERDVERYKERLHKEYLIRSTKIEEVDDMNGWEFEQFVADLLINLGYTKVKVTKKTGDGGVDILAINPNGEKTAIQCKRVKNKVGFNAIQEIYLGKKINRCKKGMIITNSYYTKPALEAGEKENLDLWCRNRLMDEMRKVDPQFHWDDYLRLFYVLPTGKQQIS